MKALTITALAVLAAAPLEAQTQALRNSTPPNPPNPQGLLLDPLGGPVVGGVWSPILDNSPGVFLPPPVVPSWLFVVCDGPMVPEIFHPYGVFLCNLLPPNPIAVVGPLPAPGSGSSLPILIPDDCGLPGLRVSTQAALVDVTGIRLTNAIDIELGWVDQGLWAVDRTGKVLRQISTQDASTLQVIPLEYSSVAYVLGANGLARNPLTGELWAIFEAGPVLGETRRLVRICPGSGQIIEVADLGGPRISGLSFDAAGTLYAVTGDGGGALFSERLWTLDKLTGAMTLVMALGNGDDGEAIGYNSLDGMLYHASGRKGYEAATTAIFEKVDLVGLSVTDVPLSSSFSDEEVSALSNLDEVNNVFYWARACCTGSTPDLFAVTPDGVETYIGPLDVKVKGLAWND